MTAFTLERIAELREILAKATPGEWKSNSKKEFGPVSVADDQSYGMIIACGDAYTREDASAISVAVNTLPAALDEIEHLTGDRNKAKADADLCAQEWAAEIANGNARLEQLKAMAAQLSRVKAERDEAVETAENRFWHDGEPPKPWRTEWFIAETIYGDKVVLKALPEEFTYDYKTADETYMAARNIKRWMRFPDSQYIEPDARSFLSRMEGHHD